MHACMQAIDGRIRVTWYASWILPLLLARRLRGFRLQKVMLMLCHDYPAGEGWNSMAWLYSDAGKKRPIFSESSMPQLGVQLGSERGLGRG